MGTSYVTFAHTRQTQFKRIRTTHFFYVTLRRHRTLHSLPMMMFRSSVIVTVTIFAGIGSSIEPLNDRLTPVGTPHAWNPEDKNITIKGTVYTFRSINKTAWTHDLHMAEGKLRRDDQQSLHRTVWGPVYRSLTPVKSYNGRVVYMFYENRSFNDWTSKWRLTTLKSPLSFTELWGYQLGIH